MTRRFSVMLSAKLSFCQLLHMQFLLFHRLFSLFVIMPFFSGSRVLLRFASVAFFNFLLQPQTWCIDVICLFP